MDLTFQVPMQYCSLQHRTLLLSPVTSTTGRFGKKQTEKKQKQNKTKKQKTKKKTALHKKRPHLGVCPEPNIPLQGPPNSCIEILPQQDGVRRWGLWETFGSRGWRPHERDQCPYVTHKAACFLALSVLGGHNKTSICKPEEGLHLTMLTP